MRLLRRHRRVRLLGLGDRHEEVPGRVAGQRQDEEAERVLALAGHPARHFLMSIPEAEQADPSVSTE